MNVDKYIDDLILREGGYVNDSTDLGGETKYGITKAVARAFGYMGDMKDLPKGTAKEIYLKNYWLAPKFDQVNAVLPSAAEELLDTGVNCGVAFAKPLLQRALNLLNLNGELYADLAVDGIYGAKTITALKIYMNKRGKDGEAVLLRVLNVLQAERYISIVEARPNQKKYFFGWMLNRVEIAA